MATSDCDMDIKDKDGRLPLHLAVIKGNMECCSYLSARNASDFSCTDNFGRTPFFYACKGKSNVHAEIADLLLEDSENNIQDEKLLSPLHFVVLNYHKSLLKRMLYSDINLDVKDAQGVTPLMVAAFRGYLGFVKLLVRRGADCNLLDSKGRNAYMFAKKFGRDNCKSYLEPRTIVKEAFIVDLSTEHSEVMRTPTRYGYNLELFLAYEFRVNAEQQAGTPTGANEFLFATDQEMTSNYPPSPCEETMDVSTSESTEFNFATQSTPFGVPYEQREDLLNGAQRLQQTYERLDAIERRQAEVPKRFDSLSDLLARNGQIEDEIQQLTQKVANANYQNDSKKLTSLLHSRKQKPSKTIDTNTFTTPLYKKNNIQPYSEVRHFQPPNTDINLGIKISYYYDCFTLTNSYRRTLDIVLLNFVFTHSLYIINCFYANFACGESSNPTLVSAVDVVSCSCKFDNGTSSCGISLYAYLLLFSVGLHIIQIAIKIIKYKVCQNAFHTQTLRHN